MRQRVITALILIPIVLGLVFARNPIPILALATTCVYFSTCELWNLLFRTSSRVSVPITVLFALCGYFLLTLKFDIQIAAIALTTIFFLSVGAVLLLLPKRRSKRLAIPALLWIITPILGLLLLHKSGPGNQIFSPNTLLMALVPVWIGDSVAIFFGKKYGKYALWPAISPKKTWEGAKANTIAAIVSAMVLSQLLGVSIFAGVLCGAMAGILGIYGDLFESHLKRVTDAKDSGTILPGHGGVLDRIDSMLMPALPIVLVLLFLQ